MRPKKMATIVLVLFNLTIILSACGAKKLDGDYTGKLNFLFIETPVTLRFSDNKVTEVDDDGTEANEGTYKINNNKLEITYPDKSTTLAELSKDKKSFTIKSSTREGGSIIKNIRFTKKGK